MKITIPLFLLFVCGCSSERLFPVAGEPCLIISDTLLIGDEAERRSRGQCNLGSTYYLDEHSVWCQGYGSASEEKCDGIDNDCDGDVDEELVFRFDHELNTCLDQSSLGLCKYTYTACIDGIYECKNDYPVGEEKCDKFDNDCDGEIDNVDYASTGELFYWPEEIPADDIVFGPDSMCFVGKAECVGGQTVYDGLQTPTKEICGNGKDDDCDGIVDEVEDNYIGYAFLILFDVSGSMAMYYAAVISAICEWAQNDTFPNSRFAVISVGDDYGWLGYFNRIIVEFTDAAGVCEALTNAQYDAGGSEYPLYAALGSNNINSSVYLDWPDGLDKRIIAFSDENVQFVSPEYVDQNNPIPTDHAGMYEALSKDCSEQENDYTFSIFTGFQHQNDWLPYASACNGFVEVLNPVPQFMRELLNQRFGGECGM